MKLLLAASLCLWVPLGALAAVGTFSAVEGDATLIKKSGQRIAARVGGEVELGDTVEVAEGKGGGLKLTLTDSSVLILGRGSKLQIDEARFAEHERNAISLRLLIGKVWSRVLKALSGSEAKFEVITDRAIAGVRGTVFRVDSATLLKAAKRRSTTTVKVTDGVVRVTQAKPSPSGAKKERHQVPGPTEISKEAWEAKFVELQANQQVSVDEELGAPTAFDARVRDEFDRFVETHQ
jgi:hypothetical protein